jgi:hypothetical protein
MAEATESSGTDSFGRIVEAVLPSLAEMLDALIETASLARPGIDAETCADELRGLALDLETLTRQIAAGSAIPQRPQLDYRTASAA